METKQNLINYLKTTHGSDTVGQLFNLIQAAAKTSLSADSFNNFIKQTSDITEPLDGWIINGVLYDWKVFESSKWDMVDSYLSMINCFDLGVINEAILNPRESEPFEILQLKKEKHRAYGFESYDWAIEHGFSLDDYESIYKGKIDDFVYGDVFKTLDAIYRDFNRVTSEDCERLNKLGFKGHSLSVSDIIVFNNKYYYCDSCGWIKVSEKCSINDMMNRLNEELDNIILKDWHFDNRNDAFLKVEYESKDNIDRIWLLGEFGYNSMDKVATRLKKIINDVGYPNAYFDAETTGRWYAILSR